MSGLLSRIQQLVAAQSYAFSDHGLKEAENDDIAILDIVYSLASAVIVEEYPDANRGPTVLALGKDGTGRPIHAVWGIHKANEGKAVLVTTYRPSTAIWHNDFVRRRK